MQGWEAQRDPAALQAVPSLPQEEPWDLPEDALLSTQEHWDGSFRPGSVQEQVLPPVNQQPGQHLH